MMMVYVLEIAASYLENVCSFLFVQGFLGEREKKHKCIFEAAIALTVVVFLLNQIHLFSVATSIMGIVLMAICSAVIYKKKFRIVFPLIGIYMLLIYIVDFCVISLLSSIFQIPNFASIIAAEHSLWRACFLIISKSILLISTLIINKRTPFLLAGEKAIWLIFGGGAFIVYNLLESSFERIDLDTLFAWILLMVILMMSLYVAVQQAFILTQKKYMETVEEKNSILLENYTILENNYKNNQIFYHDLNNQYLIIQAYLQNKDYIKAETYMEDLIREQSDHKFVSYTGVEAIDILLQYKCNLAEASHIKMNIVGETICLNIPEFELVALLGNLLDNAIEASKQLDEEKRIIQVIIRKIHDMSFIKITNYCKDKPCFIDGELSTTKENHNVHGIGLRSAKEIVNKYDGIIDFHYENGRFSALVTFFC